MFKKLKLKILSLMVLTLTLCIIIVGLISYLAVKEITYNNFIDLSIKSVSQKIENVKIYLNLIEEASKQISKSSHIIKNLKLRNYDTSVVPSLDGLKLSYSGILGVTLYDRFGISHASNSVTTYPTLAELSSNKNISDFLASNQPSFWSVRINEIAAYYNNELYNKKYGIITFISKIYDEENHTLGYLFIDIDPGYVYDFFRNERNVYMSNAQTYITNSEKIILPSRHNSNSDTKSLFDIINEFNFSSDYTLSPSKDFIVIHKNLNINDMKIITTVPLDSLFVEWSKIVFVLIPVIIGFILLSTVLGMGIAKSITKPLTELQKKMKENTV